MFLLVVDVIGALIEYVVCVNVVVWVCTGGGGGLCLGLGVDVFCVVFDSSVMYVDFSAGVVCAGSAGVEDVGVVCVGNGLDVCGGVAGGGVVFGAVSC